MAKLPPSPFAFGADAPVPDKAVALHPQTSGDATADLSLIGEIFVGARKLEPVEIWFENSAYPREDELLYEVLSAMDDPNTADLIEMPYGMDGIFDPPPLFLQAAGF